MKKTLYIHIGTHKTGSTAIQNFLYNNNDLLKNNGIDYLVGNCVWKAHHSLGWSFQGAEQPIIQYCSWKNYGIINSIEDEIKSSKCNNFIISSENLFFFKNIDFIERFFERFNDFNIKIIVYLREQSSFIESWYLELIRADYCKLDEDINYFIENPRYNLDYYIELMKWEKYVDKSNIKVFNYHDEAKDGNLIMNFCSNLGLSNSSIELFNGLHGKRNNEKINHMQMQKLREINRLNLTENEWYKRRDEILSSAANNIEKLNLISEHMRIKIKEKFRNGNTKLHQRYNIEL